MNRREFIDYSIYLVGFFVISGIAIKNNLRERNFSYKDSDYHIQLKKGGLYIETENNYKANNILRNIYINGDSYVFKRDKDGKVQIIIALLDNVKEVIIELQNTKITLGSNNLERNLFKKSKSDFWYLGDRARAQSLYDFYLETYKILYENFNNVKILIAAPDYGDKYRDHTNVSHIWSGISEDKKAILYRDNNVDPIIIEQNIRNLVDKFIK